MRKVLYFGAALLVCSAMALAQESGSTSSPSQSGSEATTQSGTPGASAQTGTSADQNTSTAGNTFQGCLMGSNGSYTLTDSAGVTYQLQGDDSELSGNVNKQVEVMGTPGATASASASRPGSANSSTGTSAGSETGSSASQGSSTAQANAAKTLNVTSIHKISDSCSENSQNPQ